MFYYRLSANQRVVIKKNVGTVNYNTGEIVITKFITQGFTQGRDYIDIFALPAKNDIIPQRNQIILIDDKDIDINVVPI